jgi:hypothetical protein
MQKFSKMLIEGVRDLRSYPPFVVSAGILVEDLPKRVAICLGSLIRRCGRQASRSALRHLMPVESLVF